MPQHVSENIEEMRHLIIRIRTLSRKINLYERKGAEARREKEALEREYQDMVIKTGIDAAIKIQQGGHRVNE